MVKNILKGKWGEQRWEKGRGTMHSNLLAIERGNANGGGVGAGINSGIEKKVECGNKDGKGRRHDTVIGCLATIFFAPPFPIFI